MKMNLYLISQDENDDYDAFSAAVVCAPDEVTARNINPETGEPMTEKNWQRKYSAWCSSVEQVQCRYLGEAAPDMPIGLVLASFDAG